MIHWNPDVTFSRTMHWYNNDFPPYGIYKIHSNNAKVQLLFWHYLFIEYKSYIFRLGNSFHWLYYDVLQCILPVESTWFQDVACTDDSVARWELEAATEVKRPQVVCCSLKSSFLEGNVFYSQGEKRDELFAGSTPVLKTGGSVKAHGWLVLPQYFWPDIFCTSALAHKNNMLSSTGQLIQSRWRFSRKFRRKSKSFIAEHIRNQSILP